MGWTELLFSRMSLSRSVLHVARSGTAGRGWAGRPAKLTRFLGFNSAPRWPRVARVRQAPGTRPKAAGRLPSWTGPA